MKALSPEQLERELKSIETRFKTVKGIAVGYEKERDEAVAKLSEATAEITRLQGEYRLIQNLIQAVKPTPLSGKNK